MNTLTLLVIGIIALFTFLGYRAGLIKTIFSIFSLIATLILTLIINPYVSTALQSNEQVIGYFSEKVEEALSLDEVDQSIQNKATAVDKLPIPKNFKNTLIKNDNVDSYDVLGVSNFKDYISNSIARMVINALSFAITFIIIFISLKILFGVLNIISKLPVLHQINKLTGLLAGFVQGLLVVWLLCIGLTVLSGTHLGRICFEMINESKFLGLVYNNNLILQFFVDITKIVL